MIFEHLNKQFDPSYQAIHLGSYEGCAGCRASTNHACSMCQAPHCWNCLFPDQDADQVRGAVCLSCYVEAHNEPPAAWYFELSRPYCCISLPFGAAAIRPGVSAPAGEDHNWHQPARAEKIIHWFQVEHGQELNVFELVSLGAWIFAWTDYLTDLANETGAALLQIDRTEQAAARRADAGIINWEQFE